MLDPASDAVFLVAASPPPPGVAADGSADAPFGSLQPCVDALNATHRQCLLLGGEHRWNATVVVEGLHGDAGNPYSIGAVPGAQPTVDGTVDIDGPWTWVAASGTTAGHWSAPMPGGVEPWQLFVDGEMMVVSRWPNARWDDASVFDDTKWAHGSSDSTYCGTEMRGQTDPPQPCHMVALEPPGTHEDGTVAPSLAAANVDATGAAAILNIGHWFSFTGEVLAHNAGNNSFTYKRFDGWKAAKYVPYHDLFYLEGTATGSGLRLLDGETEWTYDRSTNPVRLIPKAANGDPSTVDLSGVRAGAGAGVRDRPARRGARPADVRHDGVRRRREDLPERLRPDRHPERPASSRLVRRRSGS